MIGYQFAEELFSFQVFGQPLPKQSFQAGEHGGYTPGPIKEWQKTVGWEAKKEKTRRGIYDLLEGNLCVMISFWRKNLKNRCDADNLSKAVLDSLNGVLWKDDIQVVQLFIAKMEDKHHPRIAVEVYRAGETACVRWENGAIHAVLAVGEGLCSEGAQPHPYYPGLSPR